jgi:ubiquinone/menaquinone biosynthesis C-methylase UbiE
VSTDQKNITGFYANEVEKNRLESEYFMLEGVRTREVIARYAKDRKKIIDIGGGAGYYSFWLKQLGHEVHMIDLSPRNVELAREQSATGGITLDSLQTGNALSLPFSDNSFDIALLLGPLYHLISREERIDALKESTRVLKTGGTLIAAVISRYASLIDGYQRDLVTDHEFFKIMRNDLEDGVHLNNTGNMEYFTTAYFHTPQEIEKEIQESGLKFEKLIAVEGFGWIIPEIKTKLNNTPYRDNLFDTLRLLESNKDLIAASPHILAIAVKSGL